jgi:hypothetical protein
MLFILTPITIYHLPVTLYPIPFTNYHLPFTILHLPFIIYHLTFTILTSFISGKPLIDNTSIPRFYGQHELAAGRWAELGSKISQFNSIPSTAQLEWQLPDISDITELQWPIL